MHDALEKGFETDDGAEGRVETREKEPQAVPTDGLNRRVLVVDDNSSIHHDFHKILQLESKQDTLDQARSTLFGQPTPRTLQEPFEVDCANQGQGALTLVQMAKNEGRPYAVAFVDMRMPPGWDGLETIEHLWLVDPQLQIVICTAYSDQPWDEIRDRIGRTDRLVILQKPFNTIEALQLASTLCRKWDLAQKVSAQLTELGHMVEERTAALQEANTRLTQANQTLVKTVADLETAQAEILRQNKELERLASRDPLTGCLNRRAFYTEFEAAFTESRTRKSELSCLMVDIDNFKRINDQFGHAVGDQAIQAVANCLCSGLRLTDTVGRYGGEEFCLMFPRTTIAEASDLAERLRIRIGTEASERMRSVSQLVITVSIGVSAITFGARTALELIDQADKALYAAKEGGRNCVMALDRFAPGLSSAEQMDLQVKRITPRVSSAPFAR